jgi:hypothetical protein
VEYVDDVIEMRSSTVLRWLGIAALAYGLFIGISYVLAPLVSPGHGDCDVLGARRGLDRALWSRIALAAASPTLAPLPAARVKGATLGEAVAYTVCSTVGLDTSGSSIPYLATWGEGAEGEPIERYAALIDRLARRSEDVALGTANVGNTIPAEQ